MFLSKQSQISRSDAQCGGEMLNDDASNADLPVPKESYTKRSESSFIAFDSRVGLAGAFLIVISGNDTAL